MVYFQFKKKTFLSNCSIYVIVLAFLWTAGLILGILIGRENDTFLSLMRTVPDSRVSIVGLITAYFLPYLVFIAAVKAKTPAYVYLCTFFRGFISGLFSAGLFLTFGSAAWLVGLFLLSDWAVSFIMVWLFLQKQSAKHNKISYYLVAALATVAVLDHLFIAPFLVKIIG